MRSRPCSRRTRSILSPDPLATMRRATLNNEAGNGAIEVARGERAVIVIPEMPRAPSRRSGQGRLDEAKGLAEAIGVEVVGERDFRLRAIRPATLLGKGQVEDVAALVESEH